MIKAVFFDIDNTLYSFDDANVYGMQAVMEYCGAEFSMENWEIQELYRKGGNLAAQRVGADTAATHNRLLRFQCMMELAGQSIFPHAKVLCDKYWDALIKHMRPSPGIVQFFQMLKEKHIQIGIGTDMTAYIQYRKLEMLGLSRYIDMVVTSEEAGVEKPHPVFFRLCVKKAGCLAEECAFIGDVVEKDVQGAAKSSLCGVWYSQGEKPEQDMPFPVIVSFEDFLL